MGKQQDLIVRTLNNLDTFGKQGALPDCASNLEYLRAQHSTRDSSATEDATLMLLLACELQVVQSTLLIHCQAGQALG